VDIERTSDDRLVGQAARVTGIAASIGLVLWSIGPFWSPTAQLACLVVLGAVLLAELLRRRGYATASAATVAFAVTAASTFGVSRFWGIEGHNTIMLNPALLVAGLMLGPRGVAAAMVWLLAWVGVEYTFGPMPWVLAKVPDRAEQAQDAAVAFLVNGTLTALLVHHYRSFLVQTRRTGQELSDAKAFQTALVQEAPVAMLVVGPSGRVVDVNRAAAALLGGTESPLGCRLSDLLDTSGPQATVIAASGRIPVDWAEATLDASALRHRVITLYDLRHQLEAMALIEAHSRAKSAFLASMSHELRTPLNAIIGYAEILGDELTEEAALADVERIRWSGRHLLALINDVLDMTRIEAGRVELTVTDVPVDALCREAVTTVEPELKRRSLTLTMPATSGVRLATDRLRVRQVLINLLTNAVKFARTTVSFTVRSGDDRVEFVIQDDGPGIAAELRPRIFEPFVKGDHHESGVGLGLTLSRDLARRLGGDLVLSEGRLSGTCFVFGLPIPPASSPEP